MSQVQILPPRPHFADVTQVGRVPAFQAGCCRFEAGRPLHIQEARKVGVLIGPENRDVGNDVGVRSPQPPPNDGERSLIGKAPGCDPGRCRFDPGGSPHVERWPSLVQGAWLEIRYTGQHFVSWPSDGNWHTYLSQKQVFPGSTPGAATTHFTQSSLLQNIQSKKY